jgi:hypothetical protein
MNQLKPIQDKQTIIKKTMHQLMPLQHESGQDIIILVSKR